MFSFIKQWRARKMLTEPVTQVSWDYLSQMTIDEPLDIHPSWIAQAYIKRKDYQTAKFPWMDYISNQKQHQSYSSYLVTKVASVESMSRYLDTSPESELRYFCKELSEKFPPTLLSIPVWTLWCKHGSPMLLARNIVRHPCKERERILAIEYVKDLSQWTQKTLSTDMVHIISKALDAKVITPLPTWVDAIYNSKDVAKLIQYDRDEPYQEKNGHRRYTMLNNCPNGLIHMAFHGDILALMQHGRWLNPSKEQDYIDALFIIKTYYPDLMDFALKHRPDLTEIGTIPSNPVQTVALLLDDPLQARQAYIQLQHQPETPSLNTEVSSTLFAA